MSDLLQWPPGTVRADMPAHPVAVGQREGPRADDVAGSIQAHVRCTSAPSGKHTMVNAHVHDVLIKHTTLDNQPLIITTKVCQTCSRWAHFHNRRLAS